MMNKIVIFFLSLVMSVSSYAFHIKASATGLSGSDNFSLFIKTVKGDCKIKNGKYNCTETTNNIQGISFDNLDNIFNLINDSGRKQKLVKLNIKINDKSFKNCNRLEKRGQKFALKLTPTGCF